LFSKPEDFAMAKIVIIASFAESLIKFRGHLIQDMIKHNQEVIACAPDAPDHIKEELNKMGATYCDIRLNRTGLNILQDFLLFINLVKFLKKQKPDVVLTYTIKPNIYGSLSSFFAGVPLVGAMITGLGHPFSESSGKLFKFMVSFLYRVAITKKHVIFFQNQDDMELFLKRRIVKKNNRLVLINGSGVDLNHFPARKLPEEVSFLLVARLIKEKGIREYAAAAKILRRKYPAVRFRLVGPFTDDRFHISREELDRMVDDGHVEYVGPLKDVRTAIEESFVFVLPSYREGTPRSVLEAMAMSRPIITCNSAGCRETVVDGVNGYLVPTGDAEALADAMEKFFLQPSLGLEMGAASRRIAEEKYDVREVNRVILENLGLIPGPAWRKLELQPGGVGGFNF
jgi:glycosyltransferase involved in cell wall biosynthesis